MQSFYNRIQEIAAYYNIKPSVILNCSSIPYSTYHSLSYRRAVPSIETVLKIIKQYPEISFEWLAIGKGNMIIPKNVEPDDEKNPKIIALKRQVEILTDRLMDKERRILELELIVATYVEK